MKLSLILVLIILPVIFLDPVKKSVIETLEGQSIQEVSEDINGIQTAANNFLQVSSVDSKLFQYGSNNDVRLSGVNVSNIGALGLWQESDIGNIHVGEGDYEQISSLGANHVRFGLSYIWYEQDPTEFFTVMDQHIAWAKENNLWIILNSFVLPFVNDNTDDELAHINGGCYQGYGNPCNFWGDSAEAVQAREDYKDFWIAVVSRYEDEPAVAGYDLINEPWAVDDNYERDLFSIEYFTEIITEVVDTNSNSTQLFFLESEPEPLSYIVYNSYSSEIARIQNLIDITSNRIILSNHIYEPFNLTHYSQATYPTSYDGVTWSNETITNPTSPDSHPGYVSDELLNGGSVTINSVTYNDISDFWNDYPHDLRNRFAILLAQEELGIPIYIGEWGAQQTKASGSSGWFTDTFIDYNKDLANVFDDWEVHDAYYTFKAGSNNWGLYSDTGPKSSGNFTEQVAFNADSPSETVQPLINSLALIWNAETSPDFSADAEIPEMNQEQLEELQRLQNQLEDPAMKAGEDTGEESEVTENGLNMDDIERPSVDVRNFETSDDETNESSYILNGLSFGAKEFVDFAS